MNIVSLTEEMSSSTPVKTILIIMALFLFGSMIGYVIEVFYRRYFSVKKWVNPGFMKGPWLPMYGFGVVFMFLFCYLFYSCMPENVIFYNPWGNLFERNQQSLATAWDLLPICSMALMMVGLEFIAGVIFVKGFKVRLWDYTNMKGNVLGVICPIFNVIWFGVAVLYYYGVNPFMYAGFSAFYNYLFGTYSGGVVAAHFGTIFLLGMVYGIFLIDLIKSIDLFGKVEAIAKKNGVIQRYEKVREEVRLSQEGAKKKFFNLLPEFIKKNRTRDKKNYITEKIYEEARKAVLIDPEKRGTEENYDKNGRPIHEEDTK